MGFQPDVGATVVVAKLTDLGTKYLLTDPDRFIIKKFAAYDDEIDYGLWNEDHANGNAYSNGNANASGNSTNVTAVRFSQ